MDAAQGSVHTTLEAGARVGRVDAPNQGLCQPGIAIQYSYPELTGTCFKTFRDLLVNLSPTVYNTAETL